jgi:hypothetical protein
MVAVDSETDEVVVTRSEDKDQVLPLAKSHDSAVRVQRSLATTNGKKSKLEKLGHTYVAYFRYATSIDVGVGGTAFLAMPWDVSGTADFSSAAALFAECRIKAAKLSIIAQGPTLGWSVRGFVGSDPSVTNTTPSSEAAILQLPDAILWGPSVHTLMHVQAKVSGMTWASTASPVPGPYAGLYGQWSMSAVGTNSVGAGNMVVEVVVEFRGRK